VTQQFVRNPALFAELARSEGVRDAVKDRADAGHAKLLATAPSFSGPTWVPSRRRSGEYAAMSFSDAVMGASGWRAQYGSDAPWTMQVEYGTGKRRRVRRRVATPTVSLVKGAPAGTRTRTVTVTRRARPQGGFNKKTRVMYRSLMSLRRT